MDTVRLYKVLDSIHPLTESFKKSLKKELVPLSLPKNYVLLEALKVAEYVYFIEAGFAASYIYHDGKKVIEGFWKSGQIMTGINSFYDKSPSQEYIQLLQKSELICLSYSGLYRLFSSHKETFILFHKMMNQHYAKCRARIRDILRLDALDRFNKLLKAYPDIEQIATQEFIASYLGITPQSLSRIKRISG